MLSVIATAEALALVFLPCIATWPIEEMLPNDAANYCLASPWMNYVSGSQAADGREGGLADHSTIGRRRPREGGTASCATISISGTLEAYIDGITVVSGK
jgi:hypothetical protein